MEPILRKAISCTFCVVSMGLKKPLGCNALRSAKRSQKPYMPYPCLQPFGISSGYYSFLRLNQPWHPSLPHPLPQCLITSTQFCPSTMESVSLSFYNQANFHPIGSEPVVLPLSSSQWKHPQKCLVMPSSVNTAHRKRPNTYFFYLLIYWWLLLWSLASKIHNTKNPIFKY